MRIPTLVALLFLTTSGCASDPAESGSDTDETSTTAPATSGTPTAPPGPDTAETTGGSNTSGSTSRPSTGSSSTGTPTSRGSSETGESTAGDSSSSSSSSSSAGVPVTPECMTYCDEFLPNCNEIAGIQAYDDVADCEATCAGFDHDGVVGTFVGDTVQCRVAHLTFDPNPGPGYYEMHCFHAQENPTSQCQ